MVWTQEIRNENDDRPTIQRIFESLYKGGFSKMIKSDIRSRFPEP